MSVSSVWLVRAPLLLVRVVVFALLAVLVLTLPGCGRSRSSSVSTTTWVPRPATVSEPSTSTQVAVPSSDQVVVSQDAAAVCARLGDLAAALAAASADADLAPFAEELELASRAGVFPQESSAALHQAALAFAVLSDAQRGVGSASADEIAAARQVAASTIGSLPTFVDSGCGVS